MSDLLISVEKEKCNSCNICFSACLYASIRMEDGYPIFLDECRLCGECVNTCPENAIIIETSQMRTEVADYKGVLVYAEHRKGKVHPVAYELLSKGRELADHLGEELQAIIIGKDVEEGAKELAFRGADKVFIYDSPSLEDFRDDPYSALLEAHVRKEKPNIFLIGATAIGRSLGPKVAACLETGLTADCTGLEIDKETKLLLQTRPAYGGNIMATIICTDRRPQMATVRYKVMREAKRDTSRSLELFKEEVDLTNIPDRVKILDFNTVQDVANIVDADIIVSGGKGLGEPNGFEIIQELAQVLGGAVGASRPTVDEGWMEYRHQVGLSGRTVRPKIYMACGISGAVQHLAGMKTSDVILAINKDPDASIFSVSSLGAIGDLYEVIPPLIKKIKENKKSD